MLIFSHVVVAGAPNSTRGKSAISSARKLETRINEAEVVHSGPELVLAYAQLRVACEGMPSANGTTTPIDGWSPCALASPVSNDGIFNNFPGLALETLPNP